MNGRSTALLAGGVMAVGAVAALHSAPTIATFRPLATLLTPRLAGVGRPGHVALTFDDGPDPASTPVVLAALEQLGWAATFFMLGEMVRRAPGLAHEVVDAGHEVGVHGDVHRNMLLRTPRAVAADIARACDVVAEATGVAPRWFRPPYGLTPVGAVRAAARRELDTVLWTAWGRDWEPTATARSVADTVVAGRLDGGTVLLHDSDCTSSPGSWRATVAALPHLAEEFASRCLTVGPLGEHAVRGGRGW